MIISEALTWEQIGKIIGGRYRTRSLDVVFEQAKNRPEIYFDEENGTLHTIIVE